LLAAGVSLRAISAKTGIPLSAVHRVKQQIAKAVAVGQPERPETPPEPAAAPVDPHDVRCLVVEVSERRVGEAVRRGVLPPGKLDDPGTVLSALFAGLFDDYTIDWLRRRGWRGDRGHAEAIIDAVNRLIAQLPR
jgi:hypothetical protein